MTEYPIIKNSDDYPETLSWDQFDQIDWKFIKDVNDCFYDNKNNRSSTSNAAEFVLQLHSMLNQEVSDTDQTYDQEGYVIYTSVDPDGKYRLKGSNDEWDDYPVYARDYHLVNRTGTWVIVKHSDPKSIDVGELEWRYDEDE
jgi:membrane peptidoglycan carboxypeptidase